MSRGFVVLEFVVMRPRCSKKALIIGSDCNSTLLFAEILSARNFVTKRLHDDCDCALQEILEFQPDMVIIDVTSSAEESLVRKIARFCQASKIPTIAVLATGNKLSRTISSACSAHMRKPDSIWQMADAVLNAYASL